MSAWIAHAYTASGAVLALAALLDVLAADYRRAFAWLGAQILVDATDGWLARLCYVFVPVVLLLHSGVVGGAWGIAASSLVLLASAYGFSRKDAKVSTTDYFFTGFPSYWNLVAFYLYLVEWPQAVNAAVLIALAVLVFVPLRYIYPSRTQAFAGLTLSLAVIWALLSVWLLWRLPAKDGPWSAVWLGFPVYYMALSLWLDRRSRAHHS